MGDQVTLRVPDIGDFDEVDVVEVLIEAGQTIVAGDSLITLESDKASLDVPAEIGGTVGEVLVAVGDKVGEGAAICTVASAAGTAAAAEPEGEAEAEPEAQPVTQPAAEPEAEPEAEAEAEPRESSDRSGVFTVDPTPPAPVQLPSALPLAGPSVRHLALELGVDLAQVRGSGPGGRITADDVKAFVKRSRARTAQAGTGVIEPVLLPDFAKFGPIDRHPLGKIKRLTARAMTRSWLNVPHVTQHDEADITDLEQFRKAHRTHAEARGVKLSVLPFLVQAVAATLKRYPEFNASLDEHGEQLIFKRYIHIGIAVDTPDGLVVPVVRNADRMGLMDLAEELAELSGRAREGKSKLDDFQGGSFSISSLGGIGGTAFTPIVNAPEVAILGVSRHAFKPVWRDGEFLPRLMLPLSLSYDHRVIDGAAAARFTTHLGQLLGDIRELLL